MLAGGGLRRPTDRPRHPTIRPGPGVGAPSSPGVARPRLGEQFSVQDTPHGVVGIRRVLDTRPRATARAGDAATYAGGRPTYRADGRMIFGSRACSRMCAVQPTVRARANVGVNISGGMPHSSITTAA